MLFPTIEFGLFFLVVLVLSWWLMPQPSRWKPFIVAASYLFYAGANWKFCLLLAGVTLGNQLFAVLVHRARSDVAKRRLTALAVVLDLAVLGVFKYYGFFVGSVDSVLRDLHLAMPLPLLTIALPVGVSFFTFQAISYVVDVRRGLIEPASTVDVAIYLSFFPHLVAGPIVRAREFLPQLAEPRDPQRVAVGSGLVLIGVGLVKKLVIADFLARTVVDPAFGVPQAYSGIDLLFASYAYTAQIYCDFSGYTDMAIGLALLMGYVFPQNFNSPYRARSLREFWRRWHMTLSRFLRDFLYIPLGGNRKGRVRTYINLVLTMLLGGLWHGAAWTFVAWGALHGFGQAIEQAARARGVRLPGVIAWALTFHVIVLGWILFRSPDMGVAGTFLARLVQPGAPELVTVGALLAVGTVVGLQLLPPRRIHALQVRIERQRPLVIAGALGVTFALVGAIIPAGAVPPFIYFSF